MKRGPKKEYIKLSNDTIIEINLKDKVLYSLYLPYWLLAKMREYSRKSNLTVSKLIRWSICQQLYGGYFIKKNGKVLESEVIDMKVDILNEKTGQVFQKEAEVMTCPVCGKEVSYLIGDDEPGNQPDRGRRGCEDCHRPFKYTKQATYTPPSPSQMFEGVETPVKSADDLINQLKGEL